MMDSKETVRVVLALNQPSDADERKRRTTMDGKRFNKCTTNTSNNGQTGVGGDGDGIASSVV